MRHRQAGRVGHRALQGVAHDERRRPRQRAALLAEARRGECPAASVFAPWVLSVDVMAATLSTTDVARALDVSPATLRRWVAEDIVPLRDGEWTPAALAQARIVARLRKGGHSPAHGREGRRSR